MKPTLEQLKEQLNSLTEQIKKYESGERFEVGRWYKDKNSECLFNYVSDSNSYGLAHGNWVYGNWVVNGNCVKWDTRPATPHEVEAALIAEAKKRGFKGGVKYKPVNGISVKTIRGNNFLYDPRENKLLLYGWACFINGQWATIIPQEEKIEIGGYEVKITQTQDPYYNGSGKCMNIPMVKCTSIDGNIFYKDFWLAMKNISEHPKAKGMIGCSKQFDVSLETINKILSKL